MIDNILEELAVQGVCQSIDKAARIVIFTHISPDGDAMGSSLGLKHWIDNRWSGKDIAVIVPNAFPEFLSWMPTADSVILYDTDTDKANTKIENAELIICTDFGEPKRIGAIGERLVAANCTKIMIDHHLHPSDFANISISRPEASSASELIFRLILQAEKGEPKLTLDTATCLYTGMMTDTGNFSFNNANDPCLYEIVAVLLRAGIDKDTIYNSVFNVWSADRIRLTGYCLYKKLQLFPEHHTALIYLDRKELYQFRFQSGDAEGIVNLPLQLKDIHYSCFMREDKDKIKISFRSQGDRPVNKFAFIYFNGGGHANAAGGEYYGSIQDAVALFMKNFPQHFNK